MICSVSNAVAQKYLGLLTSLWTHDVMFVSACRVRIKMCFRRSVSSSPCFAAGLPWWIVFTFNKLYTESSECFVLCHELELTLLQNCYGGGEWLSCFAFSECLALQSRGEIGNL